MVKFVRVRTFETKRTSPLTLLIYSSLGTLALTLMLVGAIWGFYD